jgi:NADH-quinone oxidoreductase subunit G
MLSADSVPDMLYVVGADPVSSCPEGDPRAAAAMKTTCLIVQDSHMNRTAERATVILPAPSYGEETGTYTNNEGRVQKVQAVRPPSSGVMLVVDVFNRIAASMEFKFGPARIEQVFSEITKVVPQYQYLDLDIWSGIQDFGLKTTVLDSGPIAVEPAIAPLPGYDPPKGYSLITGDSLFQSGLLSARSEILSSLGDGPYIEMNPGDGFDKDMEGYQVSIKRNGAAITARLKVNKGFPEGLVYIPENLLVAQTNKLLSGSGYPCAVDVTVFPSK